MAGLIASALAPIFVLAFALTCAIALAREPARICKAPNELTRLTRPLTHTARRLADHASVTIVAIGSSSTAGAGASSPAASYPSRLAVELAAQFPGQPIRVINRGVNGEEADDMLARFADDVVAEKPDLVLWQVGTNSVLRGGALAPIGRVFLEGVRQLKATGADVVMIDPQFVPQVIAKPDVDAMLELISTAAKAANVDLFQRFAAMRYWHEDAQIPFAAFVSPDGLHMNDWGYGCFAKLLGASITEAATREPASAQAEPTQRAVQ
jgi:lysophospholipase L1-like esterase